MSQDPQPPKPQFKVGQRVKIGPNLYEIKSLDPFQIMIVREQLISHLGNRKFRRKAAKVKSPIVKTADEKALEDVFKLPPEEQEEAFKKLFLEKQERELDKRREGIVSESVKKAIVPRGVGNGLKEPTAPGTRLKYPPIGGSNLDKNADGKYVHPMPNIDGKLCES